MHPWIRVLDGLSLPTYFTCLMIGLAVSSFVIRREALRDGLDPRIGLDAALWAMPAGLLAARLTHVLVVQPSYYFRNPLDILAPGGGFVFYGGCLGAALATWSYARHRGVPFVQIADLLAPAAALGLTFGRLGCLGGACCYGKVADFPLGWQVPWAVRYYFRGQLPEPLLGVPLHPAPLYAVFFALALFLVLSWVRSRQRVAGESLLAFLTLYSMGRFVLEIFRGDTNRGLYVGGWLSTSQIIGIVTAVIAGMLWLRAVRR